MLRHRLVAAALLVVSLLPGCQCFGDRWNPFSRSREPSYPAGTPTGYPIGAPVGGDPNCACQQGGGPIIPPQPGGGAPYVIPPGATLPNPMAMPTIPPAGIKESPGTGKQFETDGKESSNKGSTTMPPTIPVAGPTLGMPPILPKLK